MDWSQWQSGETVWTDLEHCRNIDVIRLYQDIDIYVPPNVFLVVSGGEVSESERVGLRRSGRLH